ncbi:MAG: hypothetical protein KTR14_04860 [Vampirovibrio sp.]|nr:hypothetical protein [Vampirovibrio sp.]
MAVTAYHDIRPKLKTGDIVLFSGSKGFSPLIKWFTKSKWSHVGMVLRVPEWDMVLLWESNTVTDIADLDTGKAKKGVQLIPLSQRVAKYKGKMAVRHLSESVGPDQQQALMEFREEVKGRDFEKKKIQLIKSAYDGLAGNNVEDLSTLFCSEMVAEAYQRMDFLKEPPKGKASNEYTPADFSSDKKDELPLISGLKLTKEKFIRWTD